jgi:hypothetical protein
MAMTDSERLRSLLGETIASGKSASDTLFSEDQINDLLERHGSPGAARREGLEMKAAALATLVTTTEGSSTRKLTDAHRAVLAELREFGVSGNTGTTKIHRIVRDR